MPPPLKRSSRRPSVPQLWTQQPHLAAASRRNLLKVSLASAASLNTLLWEFQACQELLNIWLHHTFNIFNVKGSPTLVLPLSFLLQFTFLQPLAPPSWTWKVSWACRPAFCRLQRTSFRRRPSLRTPTPPLSASLRLWTTTTTSGVWTTVRGCRTFLIRTISGICCRTEGQRT